MANTKKSTKKLANREMTNGAFIMILVVGMVIAGILGWILGTGAYNLLN